MPSKVKTTTRTATEVDEFGLPMGVASFRQEQVAAMLNVTPRQLRRWRTGAKPVLPAFHPAGPKSSPLYRRADLIEFLTR